MKLAKLFENWDLKKLSIKTGILNLEWEPAEADRDAAWDMYIELLTRITTQELDDEDGVEASALSSVYALFGVTREVIWRGGRDCVNFARLAIIILNHVIRPFTAKWHKCAEAGGFDEAENRAVFRAELKALQVQLRDYSKMLAEMAHVEDLMELDGD